MIMPYLILIGTMMLVLSPALLIMMIAVGVTLAPRTAAGARRIVGGLAGWQQRLGPTIGWQRLAPRSAV
jgi:hypothetical protein